MVCSSMPPSPMSLQGATPGGLRNNPAPALYPGLEILSNNGLRKTYSSTPGVIRPTSSQECVDADKPADVGRSVHCPCICGTPYFNAISCSPCSTSLLLQSGASRFSNSSPALPRLRTCSFSTPACSSSSRQSASPSQASGL